MAHTLLTRESLNRRASQYTKGKLIDVYIELMWFKHVTAVNNHAKLKRALENCVQALQNAQDDYNFDETINQAQAVLKEMEC